VLADAEDLLLTMAATEDLLLPEADEDEETTKFYSSFSS
jgi:hypothetical protein